MGIDDDAAFGGAVCLGRGGSAIWGRRPNGAKTHAKEAVFFLKTRRLIGGSGDFLDFGGIIACNGVPSSLHTILVFDRLYCTQ